MQSSIRRGRGRVGGEGGEEGGIEYHGLLPTYVAVSACDFEEGFGKGGLHVNPPTTYRVGVDVEIKAHQ